MRLTNTTTSSIAFPDFRVTGSDVRLGRNFNVPASGTQDVDMKDFWPHIFNPLVQAKIIAGDLTLTMQTADNLYISSLQTIATTMGLSW